MEALAACSLAGNVTQFLAFAADAVKLCRELHVSIDGSSRRNRDLANIAQQLRFFVEKLPMLPVSETTPLSKEDREAAVLVTQCHEACERLIAMLERVKVKEGSRNRWKSALLTTGKTVHLDAKIKGLAKDLESSCAALETCKSIQQWPKMSLIYDQQTAAFDHLQSGQEKILQALNGNQSTEENWRRVRDMFYFQGLRQRREAVPRAHANTFEWIFRPDSDQRWSSFTHWLESDDTIYWISGKLGSGKSTLMNFILGDERTKAHLKTWATESQLIITEFFFWKPGTPLQKNEVGMLRSVLFQILETYPELAQIAFDSPDEGLHVLKSAASIDLIVQSKQRLWNLLRKILESQSPRLKLCLFLDGLDEIEDSTEKLLKFLQEDLASLPNVKLCLSSRPWLCFERALGSSPRLKLEELTFKDIEMYVNNAFTCDPRMKEVCLRNPGGLSELVDRVTSKASGVFLWVNLAVQSLKEGILNEDSPSDLMQRLEDIPDGVENLYKHQFDALQKTTYFGNACRLFRVSMIAHDERVSMLRSLSVLDLAFVIWPHYSPSSAGNTFTHGELLELFKSTQKHLQNQCLGFLEPSRISRLKNDCDYDANTPGCSSQTQGGVSSQLLYEDILTCPVNFVHRTAVEFLKETNVWAKSERETSRQASDPYEDLFRSCLTQMKLCFSDVNDETFLDRTMFTFLDRMMFLARLSEQTTGHSLGPLLDQLDLLMKSEFSNGDSAAYSHWSSCFGEPLTHLHISPDEQTHSLSLSDGDTYDDFYSHCSRWGLSRYLRESIRARKIPKPPRTAKGRPLLHYVIESLAAARYPCWAPGSATVQCLMDSGADPNEAFENITPWQLLLIFAVQSFDRLARDVYDSGTRDKRKFTFVNALQIFLQNGADPHATFTFDNANVVFEMTAFCVITFALSAPFLDTKTAKTLTEAATVFYDAGATARIRKVATRYHSPVDLETESAWSPYDGKLTPELCEWHDCPPFDWKPARISPRPGLPASALPLPLPPTLDPILFEND